MVPAAEHQLKPVLRIGCSVVATVLAVPVTLLIWYVLVNSHSDAFVGELPAALIAGAFLGLCVGGPWAYSRGSLKPLAWTVPVTAVLTLCWLLLWDAGAMR